MESQVVDEDGKSFTNKREIRSPEERRFEVRSLFFNKSRRVSTETMKLIKINRTLHKYSVVEKFFKCIPSNSGSIRLINYT